MGAEKGMYSVEAIVELLEKLGINRREAREYINEITRKYPAQKQEILETLQKDLLTITQNKQKLSPTQKQWITQEIQNKKPPVKTHLTAYLLRENKTIQQTLKQILKTTKIQPTKTW